MKTNFTKTALGLIFSLVLCAVLSGCANIFETAADKTSDEAILEDLRKKMNNGEWDSALEKFEELSDASKEKPEVIQKWASAYAGKCGLDFISYFGALSEASLDSTTIFNFLMAAWSGDSVESSACTLAHTKMEEISRDPNSRTSSQNFFMVVLGMVKVGVYLRNNLDVDSTGNLGDGTAEKNPCSTTDLPDASLDEVITGLGLVTTNLSALTTVLPAGSMTSALDQLNTFCNDPDYSGMCSKTDPSTITAGDRDNFRDVLKTDKTNTTAPFGVGNCADSSVSPCC